MQVSPATRLAAPVWRVLRLLLLLLLLLLLRLLLLLQLLLSMLLLLLLLLLLPHKSHPRARRGGGDRCRRACVGACGARRPRPAQPLALPLLRVLGSVPPPSRVCSRVPR
jgi:hypothetical protein